MKPPTSLTDAECEALELAKRAGYFVRSGQRLVVLLAWRQWCMATGHPEIVIRRGERESAIMVNGKDIERVGHELAEARAAEVARGHSETLFDTIGSMEVGRKCG